MDKGLRNPYPLLRLWVTGAGSGLNALRSERVGAERTMKGTARSLARVVWLCAIGILLGLGFSPVFVALLSFPVVVFPAPLWCVVLFAGGALGARFLLARSQSDQSGFLSSIRLRPLRGDRALIRRLILGACLSSASVVFLAELVLRPEQDIAQPIRVFVVETFPSPVWGWAISAWFSVLFVPFAEESILRGWLQTRLERVIGPGSAVLLSAVLFSAMHMQHWTNPVLLLLPFLLGVVAGWACQVTASVWSAFLVHSVWNAAVFVVGFNIIRLQSLPGWGHDVALVAGGAFALASLLLFADAAKKLMAQEADKARRPSEVA